MACLFRWGCASLAYDKHITTVDADGVALAAIQELYRMVLQKDEQLQKMQAQMLELQAELALVKAQFTRSDKAQLAALELQE